MSYTSSRPPEVDYSRNSYSESQINSDSRPDLNQKPIMRLMREKNSYLIGQLNSQPSPTQHHSTNSPKSSLSNLKQFERSLQKQHQISIEVPNQHINNSFHNSTIRSSSINSPKAQLRERFVSSFMINEQSIANQEHDDIALNHRVIQTQKYGNENLEKIKSFIVDEKRPKTPKSPQKNKSPKFYQQKSAIFSNTITSSTQKLHNAHRKTEENRRNQYIKKFIVEQMREVKPFKIENPMSQFLADKKAEKQGTAHKPLYERSIELARQIDQARLQKQQQAQQQRLFIKEQQERELEKLQRYRLPNATTKQRQEQFYNEMMQREKQKNQLKQQEKIEHLKQVTKRKPFVSRASQELFSKIAEQKDISKNFIQRNLQYQAERAKQKIKQLQKHKEEYCPFAPKISEASREKAQKYYERKEYTHQHAHQNCLKEVPGSQELEKKLKLIQERIKNKKIMGHDNVNKQKRASSALSIGVKPMTARDKSNSNRGHNMEGLSERKTADLKEDDVPVYNRSDYGNRRTNSCFNLSKR